MPVNGDTLAALLAQSRDTDLPALLKAKETARSKMLAENSAANVAAFERAKKVLDELAPALAAAPAPPTPPIAPRLAFANTKNAADVLRRLQGGGWQIEKSQFYQHLKDGKLAADRQGFYTARRAAKYAATFLTRLDTGLTLGQEQDSLATQKQQQEIERLQLQNAREKLKLEADQGRLIARSDFERELAGRLIIFDTDLQRLANTGARTIIHLVEGNPGREDELIKHLNDQFRDMLNHYATTRRFQVLIDPAPADRQGESHEVK